MVFTQSVVYSHSWESLVKPSSGAAEIRRRALPAKTNFEGMIRMMWERNLLPFRDSQDVPVWGRCGVCGRELYGPEDGCIYCARFLP